MASARVPECHPQFATHLRATSGNCIAPAETLHAARTPCIFADRPADPQHKKPRLRRLIHPQKIIFGVALTSEPGSALGATSRRIVEQAPEDRQAR